jgi:hypothetical protein
VFRHRNPEKPNFAGALEVFCRPTPLFSLNPSVRPRMQLLQINLFQSKIGQALVRRLNDVVVREDFGYGHRRRGRPNAVLRWNFGSHVYAMEAALHGFTDQVLAVPVAVRQCCIDKIYAKLKSTAQRSLRFVFAAQPLLAADSPGPKPDLAYFRFSFAQFSILHQSVSLTRDELARLLWGGLAGRAERGRFARDELLKDLL